VDDVERLVAIAAIGPVRANYSRGVDTSAPELLRSILAEGCAPEFMGWCAVRISAPSRFDLPAKGECMGSHMQGAAVPAMKADSKIHLGVRR
jgi:hypothetical protein